jgi:hypothetical protein
MSLLRAILAALSGLLAWLNARAEAASRAQDRAAGAADAAAETQTIITEIANAQSDNSTAADDPLDVARELRESADADIDARRRSAAGG